MKYVADTNIILDNLEILHDKEIVLLSSTLRELDKHKTSKNRDLAYRARKATRYIKDNKDKFAFDVKDYNAEDVSKDLDNRYEDNNILAACIENGYGLISYDILLTFKAESYGVEVIEVEEKNVESDYSGVKEIYIDPDNQDDQRTLAHLYTSPEHNMFDLRKNEYLVVWDKTKPTYNDEEEVNGYEVIDKFKFDGEKLIKLKYKSINTRFLGKIKPKNVKQELFFDLLQNTNVSIKSCFGKYGTGKDFVMITHALDMVEQGKMDKIIWARNNIDLADVGELGILPGDKIEKLIEWAMPLADHVGGREGLEILIKTNKIEIQHLGSIRGRDIKNSIIYCTEFQNNSREHAKLLIGRVGEGSQLWLNGDLQQTDKEVFKRNSGLRALSKLAGQELFGQVTLDKTERSDTAELAELL